MDYEQPNIWGVGWIGTKDFCVSCYFVPYYDYSFKYSNGEVTHIYTLNEPDAEDCPRIELFQTNKFYVLDVVWEH